MLAGPRSVKRAPNGGANVLAPGEGGTGAGEVIPPGEAGIGDGVELENRRRGSMDSLGADAVTAPCRLELPAECGPAGGRPMDAEAADDDVPSMAPNL